MRTLLDSCTNSQEYLPAASFFDSLDMQNLEKFMIVNEDILHLWDIFEDAVCITDAHGIILHINKRYSELTGITREDMVGRPAEEFVKRGVLDVVLNPEMVKTRQPITKVQTVLNRQKLVLEGHPVIDAQGNVIFCITFIRDFTSLDALKERLKTQSELLEAFKSHSSYTSVHAGGKLSQKLFTSAPMQEIDKKVKSIARTDATVLLLGETGVGKDVIARRLHEYSPRAQKTFIKVDCGSIPSTLIESELFGYAPGTFSGGKKGGKAGLIEAAARGTLFLDEVGELPLHVQTCLLRFLQDWEVMRVGSTSPKRVDARIVAATNRSLEKAIAEGKFRKDLYYRLKVAVITIPPLRERQSEILPLARLFIDFYCKKYQRNLTLTPEAEQVLLTYSWPGNVRELENFVHGLAVSCKKSLISPWDLPIKVDTPRKKHPLNVRELDIPFEGNTYKQIMENMEYKVLAAALKRYGSVVEVAKHLHVDRSTIFRKVKKMEKHEVG